MNKTVSRQEKASGMTVDGSAQRAVLAVCAENVFHLPDGLPAFEYAKDFVVLCKPDTRPFFYLQSLKPADLAFVCIDPFLVFPGYAPRLSDDDVRFLQIDQPGDLMLFGIVTVTRDYHDITVNLQAPLAINIRTNLGRQVICDRQNYPVTFRMWDALARIGNQTAETAEVVAPHGAS